METYETSPKTHQEEHKDEHQHFSSEQNLLEEAGNLSPSQEQKELLFEAVDNLMKPESHIPNLLESGHQFGGHEDIPYEQSHSPVKMEEHTPEEQNDFDFGKQLPNIPNEDQKNDADLQMNFSSTHFQADDHPAQGNSPDEVKQEESLSHEKVEEEIEEPVLQASHQKHEESIPEPTKLEESPLPSHRPAPPVPVEEVEQPSPKSQEPLANLIDTSSASPPESKSRQPETVISTEASNKTRSVRSSKADVTAGRTFLGGWLDLSRLNSYVTDLLYWRDTRKSAVVLGAILAILLSLSVVSVVSVFSYSALAVLAVTLSFRLYKNVLQAVQKTGEGHPFKEYLETDVTISTEKVHEVADQSAARLNATLLELRRLFLVEDLIDSVKFGLLLWGLTYVGSWFNGLTLVIWGVVGLFSLPKVYETHQDKIDQNVDLVRGKINEIVDKVQAVLPIGKKPKSQ